MSDLIRREDAIKAMEQRYQDILRTFKRKVKDGEKAIVLDMIGCIKTLPSADIDLSEYSDKLWKNAYERGKADRPQGEWIYCEDEYGIDGYRCSNCGRHIPWDYQHKFINFIDDYHTCPFCDARMKGADDEV